MDHGVVKKPLVRSGGENIPGMLDELLHGIELADSAVSRAESISTESEKSLKSKEKLVGELVEIKQLLLKVSREIAAELK